MAFDVGTGVVNPSYGTGTVVESNEDNTKVQFDGLPGQPPKLLKNDYLQPSQHAVKPLPEPKGKKRPEVKITPTGKFQDYLAQAGAFITVVTSPQELPRLQNRYQEITGQQLQEGSKYLTVETNKWGKEFRVVFRRPEDPEAVDMPKEARPLVKRPGWMEVTNNHFAWALISNGFDLGRNDVTSAADALVGNDRE